METYPLPIVILQETYQTFQEVFLDQILVVMEETYPLLVVILQELYQTIQEVFSVITVLQWLLIVIYLIVICFVERLHHLLFIIQMVLGLTPLLAVLSRTLHPPILVRVPSGPV